MKFFRFFFVEAEKMPIRAVRKDKAFINESVPNIFGFWMDEEDKVRKPALELWNGLRPKHFPVHPYPKIDPEAWFTYKKNGDGKVKRITLAEYTRKEVKRK